MTKAEALKLIRVFFESFKLPLSGINESNNYFQIMIGKSIISFNYKNDSQTLTASALIYQFHNAPKSQVLKAIKEEGEKENRAEIAYDAETKNLYAAKTFSGSIDEKLFIEEVKSVILVSEKWSDEKLDSIASRVFHPEEII